MSAFEKLNAINVNDKTEKKNGLTYLSWAWAWAEVKKVDPAANYTIYENAQGWNYFTDGRTCWVKTGVTVDGIEHIECLPVMNYRNESISADKVTSFEVNKAIQRSLTKACARHGLGLYIYAGEDLPEDENAQNSPSNAPKQSGNKTTPKTSAKPVQAPQSANDDTARAELRHYIAENKLNPAAIAQACGLNANSTEDDFRKALEYAKQCNEVHANDTSGQS